MINATNSVIFEEILFALKCILAVGLSIHESAEDLLYLALGASFILRGTIYLWIQ